LDPLTKDYTVAADGEYLRMPSLRQRVELALGTLKGSSSVQQTAGLTLPDKIDGNYERRVRFAINSALAFLVTSGELRVDAVTAIESRPGRSDIRVAFTDLLTGDSHSATL
jgi:phage baseplate assembly protein W